MAKSLKAPEFQEIIIVLYCRNGRNVFFFKNRQEDAGMVKVLPHLISKLIKIYKNIIVFELGTF
jgi:hypothetical protein